ncbi:hypothetical protein EDB81DRAFT_773869 [Dactylonectria macrodidyma]|uniref:Uncharacterized protein n=1 Tax=Dactylonectria macrodidyma TaxID=307937 RepID=A0A9P9JNN4_9HYPO|nr:hypothetical protein EDB81DRAFT_773869 [Dactylonectria macrodidyma]
MSSPDPPALTDTFTAPSTCYASIYGAQITTLTSVNGIYFVLGDPSQVEQCLPSAVGTSTVPYFSPGLYCPHDWTTACSRTSDGQAIATCCPPSGYVCQLDTAKASQGYWLTLYPCISYYGAAAATATSVPVIITSPASYTVDYSMSPGDAINAPGIELRTDMTASITSVTASSDVATTSVTSKHQGPTQALNIGLGVPLAILGAAVLGAAVWFFRRKKRDKSLDVVNTRTTGEAGVAEMDGKALKPTVEVDGMTPMTRVFELDNSHARTELPT